MSYAYSYLTQEIKCKNQNDNPLDTVQCLVWDPFRVNQKAFLIASWDGYLRYYQIKGNTLQYVEKVWEYFLEHPVLACDINSDMNVFVGLGGGQIVMINMKNGCGSLLGYHDSPICSIFWVEKLKVVISVGYDTHIKIWNVKYQNGSYLRYDRQVQDKIHTAAFEFPYLLIGSYKGQVMIIDMNNFTSSQSFERIKNFEIYSKFSCAKIHAQNKRFLIGTVDGRTIMGDFTICQHPKIQNAIITKSQKKQQDRKTIIGQCNSVQIGFHNGRNFYIIAGSMDLGIYNIQKKEKSKSIKSSPCTPITCTRLSPKNDYLAYVYGNDWSQGLDSLNSIRKPKIVILKLSSTDLNSYVSK